MNDAVTREKVTQFLNDTLMADTIKDVFEDILARPSKDRDVHLLAAKMIAIELLQETWKELAKLKNEKEQEPRISKNPGI